MADLAATPTKFIPKKVDAFQLAAASAVVYTVPAGTATKVVAIMLVNDTTTAVTATIHFCPNGADQDPANYVCSAISVPSDGVPISVLPPGDHYLNATDTIEAFASAATQVTCHISVVEESVA